MTALLAAALGVGVFVGTGAAAAIQATRAAEQRTVGTFEFVTLDERGVDLSAYLNPNPSITTLEQRRFNDFGSPVYDADTDPALVTYPSTLTTRQRELLELLIARNFVAAQCMNELGLDFTFSLPWERTDRQGRSASIDLPAVGTPEWSAYVGSRPAGEDDSWQDAGCLGYAEHVLAPAGGRTE